MGVEPHDVTRTRREKPPATDRAADRPSATTLTRGGPAAALTLCGRLVAIGALPSERLTQPIRRATLRSVPALDLLFDVQARLDVGQQLVGGELSETGDRLTEACAEMGFRAFQQELPERLLRDPFGLGVQDLGHLQLEEAGIRTLRTARLPVAIGTAVSVVSVVVPRPVISVIVASAIVHHSTHCQRT